MISKEPWKLDLNEPHDVAAWSESARHFKKGIACLRGTHELVDLMALVANGSILWFPGETASALVEVINYPRIKVASVFLVAGELPEIVEWIQLDGSFDTWAREQECERSQYVGRPGFKRVFENVEHYGDLCMRSYT